MRKVLRGALIAGVIAAVGVAGTAGAARFITGKDIKNGSIGVVDLSRSARRALAGKTGPAGPQGAPGPAGATGPTGPAGPSSLSTTVRSQDFPAPANNTVTGEVRCPDGMVATGGSVSPGEALYVVTDVPSTDGRGWIGTAHDVSGTAGSPMRVTVICTPGSANVLPTGS